jgi:hypothetical protein
MTALRSPCCAGALLAALLLAGCATSRYIGPTSGRSSESQAAMASAVESALSKLDLGALAGRSIAIRAASLTERAAGRSPEEEFLEEAVLQKALAQGALVADEAPEVEVRVLARALGVTRTRRDFIPLYYAEVVEGVADLRVSAYRTAGAARSLLWEQPVQARTHRRKAYYFYIFGPAAKQWVE